MPVRKVKGGYSVQGTNAVHKTKAKAKRQQRAIKANQGRKR